jgi:hypothetical protein
LAGREEEENEELFWVAAIPFIRLNISLDG